MQKAGAGGAVLFAPQALPDAHEQVPFPGQLLQTLAPAGGAGDEPPGRGPQFFQGGLEPLAFRLVVDAPGNPQLAQGGHIDQVMTGQADVGGEAGAFVGRGAPQHLDQHFLALVEQVADGGGGQPPGGRVLFDLAFEPDLKKFIFLGDDIFGKEVGGPLQAHIHKGCGHAGQEPGHPALVDVAHGTVLGLALDVKLRQASVFEKRHPGVPFGDADEQ